MDLNPPKNIFNDRRKQIVQKFMLLDGHNLLFRMFYGMPARIFGKNNKPIHGTIGFVGALYKTIKAINPTHILVVFDGENGSNRNEINTNYKSNRIDYSLVEEKDNPFSQLDDILLTLEQLSIKYCITDGFEADDVMKTEYMRGIT
jgi:DNA polymerase-1